MHRVTRTIIGGFTGAIGGAALVLIACLLTAVLALTTNRPATVPGIFQATPGQFDGSAALEFTPYGTGMLMVVGICMVLGALTAAVRSVRPPVAEPSR